MGRFLHLLGQILYEDRPELVEEVIGRHMFLLFDDQQHVVKVVALANGLPKEKSCFNSVRGGEKKCKRT